MAEAEEGAAGQTVATMEVETLVEAAEAVMVVGLEAAMAAVMVTAVMVAVVMAAEVAKEEV